MLTIDKQLTLKKLLIFLQIKKVENAGGFKNWKKETENMSPQVL